jgi:hypothetical protein
MSLPFARCVLSRCRSGFPSPESVPGDRIHFRRGDEVFGQEVLVEQLLKGSKTDAQIKLKP